MRIWDGVFPAKGPRWLLVAFLLTLGPASKASAPQSAPDDRHWVASWATASVARPSRLPADAPSPNRPSASLVRFNNQTLRQIVHVTLGGSRLRVVLSNVFGTAPLPVGSAYVAVVRGQREIDASSARRLTFAGVRSAQVPAGSLLASDPVELTVPPLSDLAVDVYLPGDTAAIESPITTHSSALTTNFVSTTGDYAGNPTLPVEMTTRSWFFLARIDVYAARDAAAAVALGDSITDGAGSTPDTNSRWPDQLARALTARSIPISVLNMGISGNRVLADTVGRSALNRFDTDVAAHPGVASVVFVEGINDIGSGTRAEALIDAQRTIINRARARGLRIIGGTLSPIEGTSFQGYYTSEHEYERQRVNTWIRTSGQFDAVVDIDAVLRDPAQPTRLRPLLASPDFIHPNDAGYRSIADAIDLAWFRSR